MNKIYYALININDSNPNDLPSNILEHTSKYHLENQNRISRIAWSKLGELIKEVTNENRLEDIKFSSNGKPLLDNLFISLSHNEDYVLVSVSNINHGVDIEFMKEDYNPKIINKFMGEEVNSKYDFYKLWTSKEVVTKIEDISLFEKTKLDDYYIFSQAFENQMISLGAKQEFELEKVEL